MKSTFVEKPAKLPEVPQMLGIIVSYLCPGNVKGSRIKFTLPRWKKSKVISYDHSCRDTLEIALRWFHTHNIIPVGFMDTGGGYTFAVDWSQRPTVFNAFSIPESK